VYSTMPNFTFIGLYCCPYGAKKFKFDPPHLSIRPNLDESCKPMVYSSMPNFTGIGLSLRVLCCVLSDKVVGATWNEGFIV